MTPEGREPTRLYLITPPRIDLDPFSRTLTEALDSGDVACLQLRLKEVPEDDIRRAVDVLLPITQAYDVALLLNDDARLAAELGVDGVHVGQEDTPYDEARRLLGPDAIIGVTCHDSRHLAMEAGEAGADYVAFGAFFPTTTKTPKFTAGLDLLSWWQELMEIPCVAIGGITVENCRPLVEAGADFLAVSAGVWGHDKGPGDAVRQFNAIFDSTSS
ncbi:thiamine phosphate synthase [Iodidimonas sp. SYSU 1G8]|uniref:thiamine phosphate synthase n=1 Tax=Iodidimonas sp. SYSU 1G8 TaxID=3133967 RepID=UPI0031FE5FAC